MSFNNKWYNPHNNFTCVNSKVIYNQDQLKFVEPKIMNGTQHTSIIIQILLVLLFKYL